MSNKRLSRIVILAFAMAMLLAVSSLAAFKVNIDNTVSGLENGVSYTVAQYDFANNTYGEFAELTSETVLTTGTWGIKAGDAEPEVVFVQGTQSGKTSFWTDGATSHDADIFSNSVKDTYVPGKWTLSTSAFANIRGYKNPAVTSASVCIDIRKSAIFAKIDVPKTTTVDGTAYPLYTIDGAEYYLKEEAYYAVSDNSLYEGEGEAVAVTVKGKWSDGITHLTGDDNLLQEAEYFYGFTNEQIVPADSFVKYSVSSTFAPFVGSLAVNEKYDKTLLVPDFTFHTKKIGSDEVTKYTVKLPAGISGTYTVELPAEVPSDAYIVAISVAPYVGLPDDYFVNKPGNTEDNGYFHQYLSLNSSNGFTLQQPVFDAPTGITGGITKVEGLDATKDYQIAPVTLDSTGKGYAIGTWTAVTPETTGLAGLNVVRFCSPDGAVGSQPSDIFYITGNAQDRQKLSVLKDDGKITASNGDAFVPGAWKGASCGVYEQPTNAYAVLDQVVGSYTDDQTLWLYQHTEAEAEAKLTADDTGTYPTWTGGRDATVFQAIIDEFYASKANTSAEVLAAEKKAQQEKIAATVEKRNFKYAYDNTEVIPVDQVITLPIAVKHRQGSYTLNAKTVVVFKVMDLDGNVKDYTYTSEEKTYKPGEGTWNRFDIDMQTVLAGAQGYLVGFQIYPVGDVDPASIVISDGSYLAAKNTNARFIQNHWHAGYYYGDYEIYIPVYPKLTGVSGGYGVIEGLEEGVEYQYSTFILNAEGTGLVQGEWTDLTDDVIPAGLIKVRKITVDGGVTEPSDMIYVYGSALDREDLGDIDAKTGKISVTAGTDFVTGKWTGKAAATHSSFKTYVVSTLGEGWITTALSNAVKDAEAALAALGDTATAEEKAAAQAKVDAARRAAADAVINNPLKYAYTADEVIPLKELNTFGFTTAIRMGCVSYSGNYTSTVKAYIAQLDGTVAEYVYTTAALGNAATRTVDFVNAAAWTPALPAEGYVVGLSVDQWSGWTDPAKYKYSTANKYNTMPAFTYLPEKYSIEYPDLPPVAKPKLYVEGSAIKGLDANTSYKYAKANLSGIASYQEKVPAGSTEFAPGVGLWAVYQIGDGLYTGNSAPVIYYIAGNSTNNIIHTTSTAGTGPNNKGEMIDLIDQASVGYNLENRKNPTFKEAVWTGMNITTSTYLYWEIGSPLNLGSTSCTVSPKTYRALLDELEALQADATATEAAIAEAQAKVDAEEENLIEATNDIWFTYQYTDNEIIHMNDFWSITVKPWVRQTSYGPATGFFKTKFVLKVMTKDGTIVDAVATKNATFNSSAPATTFYRNDFNAVDGYIVGMIVYPYGEASDNLTLKWTWGNKTAITADFDLTLYSDGYKIVEPAPAPTLEFSAATNGVTVSVTNSIEGATYSYSLDNKTWTTAPTGADIFVVEGVKEGDTVYVKMNAYLGHLDSAVTSATVPEYKDVPALALGEGNVLSDASGLYEIAKYSFNEELVYETLTEKTLTTGVWAVRTKADETAMASADQVFYIAGDEVGTINYAIAAGGDFVSGRWTNAKGVTLYTSKENYASAGKIEMHVNAGAPYTLSERRSFSYKYRYTDEEIVPVDQLVNIKISTTGAFYHGYLNEGYSLSDGVGARTVSKKGQTLARVYVAGAGVPYYDVYTEIEYKSGYSFNIGDALAGKEGYVVALELFPVWSVYGEDNKTDLGDDCITALWLTSVSPAKWSTYTYKFHFPTQFIENDLPAGESLPTTNAWATGCYSNGTNRYALKFVKTTPAAPTVTVTNYGITIGNYDSARVYAYSTDGGNTWTRFNSSTLTAIKASTEYIIKSVENSAYFESESVSVTSRPVVIAGTSLVLDGQIGTKVYLDVDTTVVDVNTLEFHITRVNSDFANVANAGNLYRQYGKCSLTTGNAVGLTKITYEEDKGLYSLVFYMPAKDIDNFAVENELTYKLLDGTEVKAGNIGSNLKVTTYIASAKALAEEGDEAFVEALPLVNALETYAKYADAYFNKKTVGSYDSDATITADAPSKAGTLAGAEFYGTSILLEDQVTIRHYFKVTDEATFVGGQTGTKNGMVYFDITDIPAQDIGKTYTLTVGDLTVSYSVANYLASAANSRDTNLASLAAAMYDYYLAAVEYSK